MYIWTCRRSTSFCFRKSNKLNEACVSTEQYKDSVCCKHLHLWTSSSLCWQRQCLSKWSVGVKRAFEEKEGGPYVWRSDERQSLALAAWHHTVCSTSPAPRLFPSRPPTTRNIWPVDRAATEPKRICCIEKFTVQVLKFLETWFAGHISIIQERLNKEISVRRPVEISEVPYRIFSAVRFHFM
jgi:hypothetical protein